MVSNVNFSYLATAQKALKFPSTLIKESYCFFVISLSKFHFSHSTLPADTTTQVKVTGNILVGLNKVAAQGMLMIAPLAPP